jgi:uncharacterized coiled-coil protein SlyX
MNDEENIQVALTEFNSFGEYVASKQKLARRVLERRAELRAHNIPEGVVCWVSNFEDFSYKRVRVSATGVGLFYKDGSITGSTSAWANAKPINEEVIDAKLDKTIAKLDKTIAKLDKTIVAKNKTISAKNKTIAKLRAENEEVEVAELDKTIAYLDKTIAAKNKTIAKLEESNEELRVENEKLIAQNTSRIAAAGFRGLNMATRQEREAALDKTVAELRRENEVLTAQPNRPVDQSQEIAELRTYNADLEVRNTSLIQASESLCHKTATLQERNADLEVQIKHNKPLVHSNIELRAEIASLRSLIKDHNDKCKGIQIERVNYCGDYFKIALPESE